MTSLPPQVSPPEFALGDISPAAVVGADVVAIPVLPGLAPADGLLLGPGAAELGEELDVDLLAVAELHGLTGATGETASYPVPSGSERNPDLRTRS